MATGTTSHIEPTAELESECRAILYQWQSGELDFTDAARQMKSLKENAILEQHIANQARVEYLLGYMQVHRGKMQTSIEHFQTARNLFKRAGNEVRVTRCDLNLGEVHRQLGDFTKARHLFRTAYENSIEQKEYQTSTFALANEGQVLLSMGSLDAALQALTEANDYARKMPRDAFNALAGLLCEVNYALSVIYLQKQQPDKAWKAARSAYDAAKDAEEKVYLGQANRAMGETLTALEPDPASIDIDANPDIYFEAALEAFKEVDAEGEIGRTLHAQAISLARRGKRVPAARKLQKATIIFARLGMTDDAARAAESQSRIF